MTGPSGPGAITVGVSLEGVGDAVAAILKLPIIVDEAARLAVDEGAKAVQRNARRHAYGRPGPRKISGHLVDTLVATKPHRVGLAWAAEVGPTARYGRRIELGFHQADSLGRQFDQPAFPFLRPGLVDTLPSLAAIYSKAWRSALGV